jgi:hypothetical protein
LLLYPFCFRFLISRKGAKAQRWREAQLLNSQKK